MRHYKEHVWGDNENVWGDKGHVWGNYVDVWGDTSSRNQAPHL